MALARKRELSPSLWPFADRCMRRRLRGLLHTAHPPTTPHSPSLTPQGNKRITIRTSALEEKATACSMLQSYATELKGAFLPYVQDVAKILVPLIKFRYMDDVRTASMMAMPELLQSAVLGLQESQPGASQTLVFDLKNFMFAPIMEQLRVEPDVETLNSMLNGLSALIDIGEAPSDEAATADPAKAQLAIGAAQAAAFTSEQQQACTNVLFDILRQSIERRGERSKDPEDDEPDEEEEEQIAGEQEREENLISSIVECLGSFLKVHHSSYLPVFEESMANFIMTKMLQPTSVSSDRTAALCVFDDVIEHCSADGGSSRYIDGLFPAYLTYAQDESTDVRQAAVYGIGVLAEFAAAQLDETKQQQAAQALVQVIERPGSRDEENATATDNAVSALGKLCKLSETIAAPALPRWLTYLPLKDDVSEALLVHKQLASFVEASNVHLLGAQHERLPDVIIVFGQILEGEASDEELNRRIGHLLRQVHASLPHVLQALPSYPGFAKLTAEQRGALEKAISSAGA